MSPHRLARALGPVWCLAVIGAVPAPASAQTPSREARFYQYYQTPSLVRGGTVAAHWMADGRSFWYMEGGVENTAAYRIDPAANSKTPFFDPARLRHALAPFLGHDPPYAGLPFRAFDFVGKDERVVRFVVEGRSFELDLGSYAVHPVAAMSEAERIRTSPQLVRKGSLALLPDVMEVRSPDGRWFAGVKNSNLQVRSPLDGRTVALTDDGGEHFGWDVLGAQWSPNGLLLAVNKIDTRAVPPSPIVHWLKPTEDVEWVQLGRSGGPRPVTEFFVVDVVSGRRTRIDAGDDAEQSVALVGWRGDGSEVVLTREDRRFKRLDLLAANAVSGKTRLVLTETQATFVQPAASPLGAAAYAALKDGRFLWLSERTGWNNIYLYGPTGTLIRPLTALRFPVTQIVTVNESAGWVYFAAHGDPARPYDTHLYRVRLTGGPVTRLTDAPGTHVTSVYLSILGIRGEGIQFSPDQAYFLDSHSNLDRPPQVDLRRADGTLIRTVVKADTSGLSAIGWKPPEEFRVKAADGITDLYGVMYRPGDFDAGRKYPVVDYIYNGPQTTWVPRTFGDGRGTSAGALAQLGFVVFMVDGRGTTERGKQFQDVVYGQFGRNEIPDHVATIKQLGAKYPYLDLSRVGVIGGSFGGFMTLRAMLLAPETFHVGVATAPIADLYGVNVDMYMGLPQENTAGYEYASNLKIAGQLKGKLLLIHGTSDVNAPFAETMRMADALTRAGKQYDLIILPEETHAIGGGSAAYRMSAERRFLEQYLKP